MKVNHVHRVGAVNPYSRHDQRQPEAAGKKGKLKDEVSISSEAKELHGAGGAAAQEARVRKIAELKQEVASGSYKVEAGKIAEKLLPYIR